MVHFGLDINARPLRWVKTSSQKIKHTPPDINKDDAKVLDHIDGIGLKIAQRIVAYRMEHGPFASIEGLTAVKGITKKTLVKIKAFYLEAAQQDE